MLNAQVGFRNLGIVLCAVAAVLLALNLVVTVPAYAGLANPTTKTSNDLAAQTGLREVSGAEPLTAQVTGEETPPKHTITVSGTGTASSKPEMVTVYISIVTKGETASDAQSLNAEKADAVVKALKAAGIKEEQMETTGFTLQPVYQWVEGLQRSVLTGYECRNSIKVSTEDLGSGGKIADLAVSAGANEVSSISFTLKPETVEKLKLEALAKAVEEAKAKVNVVAQAAGITLIGPITINIDTYIPTPINYYEAYKATSSSTPIIVPQELSTTATVSMVYEFQ